VAEKATQNEKPDYDEKAFESVGANAPEEVKQGLAFGIYEYDHSEKYIKDVFRYIDTDQAEEHTEFMLNILEAESLEEALSWAQ